MTPSGIEPETFRFVAQRLNHCATAVPPPPKKKSNISELNHELKKSVHLVGPFLHMYVTMHGSENVKFLILHYLKSYVELYINIQGVIKKKVPRLGE